MAKCNNTNWLNKNLRFALANALNKSESQITKEYLKTLKEVDLSQCGLKDLEGIHYAKNLISLNLSKNCLTNVDKLKKLKKLKNLELCENRIEDISFLKELKSLESVGLESNNIDFIPDLKPLTNLKLLNVSNNKISDLSFINTICSQNLKVIASEQCVLLNPISIDYGEDYLFKPYVTWDKNNQIHCDNIQVTGNFNSIETDERPFFLYSVSKVLIKNIYSDCIIKAEFFHEVPYLNGGILSGILIQPIFVKLANITFNLSKLKKEKSLSEIYGKIEFYNKENINLNSYNSNIVKNKTITIINTNGDKLSCLTNSKGEYKFKNLEDGRYTILFPFVNDYKYISPSLFVCNIREGESKEINSVLDNNK